MHRSDPRPAPPITREMVAVLLSMPPRQPSARWAENVKDGTVRSMLIRAHLVEFEGDQITVSKIGRTLVTLVEEHPAQNWQTSDDAWTTLHSFVVPAIDRANRIASRERQGKRCEGDETCDASAVLLWELEDAESGERLTRQTCAQQGHAWGTEDGVRTILVRELPNRRSIKEEYVA